jgi:hypothetical protein
MTPPNPSAPANVKRFRTNPVEVAIFSVITLVFFNSVYHLFYDQGGFKPAALAPMAANPISEGNSQAPATQPFVNVDVRCDANADQDTTAAKVRLVGALCDSGRNPASVGQLAKVTVINTANRFTATVFTDVNAGKYSTDYIPLNLGKNPIHLEFTYRDGKTVDQQVNVIKN